MKMLNAKMNFRLVSDSQIQALKAPAITQFSTLNPSRPAIRNRYKIETSSATVFVF
jgi:hypothetical protein